MFERYTEPARRIIFFARYEASQFGCPQIQAEHLLLGLLRQDTALVGKVMPSPAGVEKLRRSIERRSDVRTKILTSVDLPLSHESKRALAYAAEECERLNQKQITPAHLLLGLLREEKSFAAELLREQGVTVESVRKQVLQSLLHELIGHLNQTQTPPSQARSVASDGFSQWIAEREADGRWIIEETRAENGTIHSFAFYDAGKPAEEGEEQDLAPSEELARAQMRIRLIVRRMERAIANHEFEKARFYSDEERKEREHRRRLCEQFNLEPAPEAPVLCIVLIDDDHFSDLRKRCEGYISEGVTEVWLLDLRLKRAYTITGTDGLREFKGEILRVATPPLEMHPGRIFDQG